MQLTLTGGPETVTDGDVRIRHLPANTRGRDLVVGDVHGCARALRLALDRMDYDPDAGDRLFLVGDLCDRGPDSPGTPALAHQLGAYAARGNHEAMLLDALMPVLEGRKASETALADLLLNGGRWIHDLLTDDYRPDDRLAAILRAMAELPHLYVVGEGANRFHVLHAELPEGVTDAAIDAGLPGIEPLPLIWSRTLMDPRLEPPPPAIRPGLSPTYAGHTPAYEARRRENHVCLDVGTFETGAVAVADATTGEVTQFPAEGASDPVLEGLLR